MSESEKIIKVYNAILNLLRAHGRADPTINLFHVVTAVGEAFCLVAIEGRMTKDSLLDNLGRQFDRTLKLKEEDEKNENR